MYKWDAEDYQKSSSEQQKWARELIAKLQLEGDERVLDIGCGDGKVTAEIAFHVKNGSVLGIDSSPEMIELAQKTFSNEKYPYLSFQIKDARELDFEEEFDLISNAALHWIKDQLPILESIQRSLKPGGRLLVQMGGRGNGQEVLKVADSIINEEKWRSYFKDFEFPFGFYGPDEYREWLKKADLTVVRVELLPKIMVQQGIEGFKSWIRTTWLPYTQRVPEKLQKDFVDEIAYGYLEKHPLDSDGLVHLDMVRLEIEAKKPMK